MFLHCFILLNMDLFNSNNLSFSFSFIFPLTCPPLHHQPIYSCLTLINPSIFFVLFSIYYDLPWLICVCVCVTLLSDPIDPDIDFYDLFNNPYTPAPDPTPMLPPVGVQATVLSHDTVKVSWADNSLAKNQKITDSRYYSIRWKTNIPANTKFKVSDIFTERYFVRNRLISL